jgi:integrase
VPLSSGAIAVLKSLPRFSNDPRVFPICDVGVRRMLKLALGRRHLTVHGFRSTFRDWAGDHTTFQREIIEAALAHVSGDATERAYRRGDALEKRRALMDAWAAYCDRPANILDFARKA